MQMAKQRPRPSTGGCWHTQILLRVSEVYKAAGSLRDAFQRTQKGTEGDPPERPRTGKRLVQSLASCSSSLERFADVSRLSS